MPLTQPHADGRPIYSRVQLDSPRGSVMTLPLLLQCVHNTFHLGLDRPESHQSVCAVVTLFRVSPPHLVLPPMCTRVCIASMHRSNTFRAPPLALSPSPHNLEMQTRGWVYATHGCRRNESVLSNLQIEPISEFFKHGTKW